MVGHKHSRGEQETFRRCVLERGVRTHQACLALGRRTRGVAASRGWCGGGAETRFNFCQSDPGQATQVHASPSGPSGLHRFQGLGKLVHENRGYLSYLAKASS
jgi:hypothetical protein